MSELFDRVRSTAGKASFEAEKFRRITAVQSIVKSLYTDLNKGYQDTGRLAFLVYQKEGLNQPDLRTACEKLQALQDKIAEREREIELIRQETFEEQSSTIPPSGSLVCPKGHGPLLADARFCMECGSQGVRQSAPAAATCSKCGERLQADARFCSNCGQSTQSAGPSGPASASPGQSVQSPRPQPQIPVEEQAQSIKQEQEQETEPEIESCINCGVELPADATVCPECNFSVADPSPKATVDDDFFWASLADSEIRNDYAAPPPVSDTADQDADKGSEDEEGSA